MIRLLLALLVIGALGHFLRGVFARRFRGTSVHAAVQTRHGAGSTPVSMSRRMAISAAKSVLVGGAVVLVLFVGKLIYFELTRSAPARTSVTAVVPPGA